MAESHVVSALADKRAELAGQIIRTEQQLGQFRADLVHVDATIRLFAPDIRPETIQAKVIRRRMAGSNRQKSSGACSTRFAAPVSRCPRLMWSGR